MIIEKFRNYEYEIFEYPDDDYPMQKYYYYRIYNDSAQGYIESEGNMFDRMEEAKFASVGHILQLIKEGLGK